MRFLISRLLASFVLLIAMSVVTFTLTRLVPGDPARVAAGPHAPEQTVEKVRLELGLNKALPVQYWDYLKRLAHLNLGVSFQTGNSVLSDIGHYAPPTLELVVSAMVLTFVLGVALGVIGALTAGSLYDRLAGILAASSTVIPVFWFALILQLVLFYELGVFPSGGQIPINATVRSHTGFVLIDAIISGQWGLFWSALVHLVLPVLALTLTNIGIIVRVTRQSLLREMSRPYALVARSKGLRPRQVLGRHLLRNALNPVISLIGIQFGYAITGAVLVESIFDWPGLGHYAVDAISNIDYPVIMAVTLFVAVSFAIVNLAVDLAQAALDPRIRSHGR